jgi:hypothetical protein
MAADGSARGGSIGEGKAGSFSKKVSVEEIGSSFRLKIEAVGYEPCVSRELNWFSIEDPISVILFRQGPLVGRILRPDGSPASDAQLVIPSEGS